GLPGIQKQLDIAYALRDLGWNCLYFHFRGCWGSHGNYSLAGLTDDTCAAVEWVRNHPAVDPGRIVLIGTSTGSHPALLHAAMDFGISSDGRREPGDRAVGVSVYTNYGPRV